MICHLSGYLTYTVILQQHNGYCLRALTDNPFFFFFFKVFLNTDYWKGGKRKGRKTARNGPNIIILLLSISYHHLHILLEASAVCSGTVDLAKMLFLCYGWKPKMEI